MTKLGTVRTIKLWRVQAALSFCTDDFRAGFRPCLNRIKRDVSLGLLPVRVAMDNSPFGPPPTGKASG